MVGRAVEESRIEQLSKTIGQRAYQVKLHYFNTLHFVNGHLISTDFNGNVYMREDLDVLLLWLPACEAVLLLATKDKTVT